VARSSTTAFALAAAAALTSLLAIVATSSASSACAVTVSPARTGVGFAAAAFNYGSDLLRAELYWPQGTLIAGRLPDGGSMAGINRDGSIDTKVGWWRGVPGQLVIRGRRLDAPAPPLKADAGTVASYGRQGFVPGGITFPTTGCWEVTGTVGRASLTFVVEVTKPPDAVLTDCSTRSDADFPTGFSSPRNLVVGPLVLVNAAYTPPAVVEAYGGQKFQALVRNGHSVTLELAPGARPYAGLAYGALPQGEIHLPDTHRVVSFQACARGSGSTANRKPVTFWAGGVLASSPRCIPLLVRIDHEPSPRLVSLRMGVRRC
jgi:hypothetical protein